MPLYKLLEFSAKRRARCPVSRHLLPRPVRRFSGQPTVGFAETVPDGTTGDAYLAYQPYLYVVNGCVPFPGVDAAGNTKYESGNLAVELFL